MRALVIGGRGYVGRRVVEALDEDGHETWTLGRHAAPGRHLVADRDSPGGLASAISALPFDAVVDVAADHPRHISAAVDLFNGSITRYVFISSGIVHDDLYGRMAREEDVPLPEGDPPQEQLDYQAGKRWCEAVLARARANRFPGVSVRPPAVLGAHDRTGRIVAYFARIEDGGPLLVSEGLADRGLGLVWGRDIGALCALLLRTEPRSGAYNIAFLDLTFRSFVQQAAEALGAKTPELVEVSEQALRAAGLELLDVSPYGPLRSRPGGYDLTRLRSELHFEPSSLDVALREVVEWYRRERPTAPGYGSREAELHLARAADR